MAPWATIAVDVITQWQVGTSPLVLPGTVTFTVPNLRHVEPTNIPDRRDRSDRWLSGIQVPGGERSDAGHQRAGATQ